MIILHLGTVVSLESLCMYTGCMLLHMQGHQSAIFNRVKVIECDHAGGIQKFVDYSANFCKLYVAT